MEHFIIGFEKNAKRDTLDTVVGGGLTAVGGTGAYITGKKMLEAGRNLVRKAKQGNKIKGYGYPNIPKHMSNKYIRSVALYGAAALGLAGAAAAGVSRFNKGEAK